MKSAVPCFEIQNKDGTWIAVGMSEIRRALSRVKLPGPPNQCTDFGP